MVDQLVGITLSGCKIIKLLGKGGMGSVFLGRQVDLGRFVAVKILSKNLIQEEGFLRRFKREARSVASLSHPNIVQVYQYGEEDGIHFIVMEYIEGETLGARLIDGAIDEQEAIKIAKESALALAAAHEKKIVHRDIKPDNIILSKQDETKVTDFGLAKQLSGGDQQSLVTKQIIGTPAYISPEQIKGAPIDPRSDVYSLGATMYHSVAGKPPFSAKNPFELLEKHLKEKPVPPNEINEVVSAEMSDVVLKCLEKDPKYRYQSPEELIEDLERLEKGEKPIAARRSISFAWPMKILMAAALVAVIVWAGSQVFKSGPDDPGTQTTDNGVDVRNLNRQKAIALLQRAAAFGEAGDFQRGIDHLEQALELLTEEDPEWETTKARIIALEKKMREAKAARLAESKRKGLREKLMDQLVETDREDAKALEKLLGALDGFLETYPDDERMSGLRKRVVRWHRDVENPDGPPDNGTGGGRDPKVPPRRHLDAKTDLPQLVPPLPLDYEPPKPPPGAGKDGDEGEKDGDEEEEDDGGRYPPTPFQASIFLKSGGMLPGVTVVKIDQEAGKITVKSGGGILTYEIEKDIDRIVPKNPALGRVPKGRPIERPLSQQYEFNAPTRDTKSGYLTVTYSFNDPKQKEDWTFNSGAVFDRQDKSVRLVNRGVMELKTMFQRNVQVEIRLRTIGRTQGKLQVGIYGHSLTLSTVKNEPPAMAKFNAETGVWDMPGKVSWPPREKFPLPYLEPDSDSWFTVRRIAGQIYLNDMFSESDDDILMPIRVTGGGGKIAIRSVNGTFVIDEVKITGTPRR